MSRYTVAEATQVLHDGVLYTGGQSLEADPATAERWLLAEWVTEATPTGTGSTTPASTTPASTTPASTAPAKFDPGEPATP